MRRKPEHASVRPRPAPADAATEHDEQVRERDVAFVDVVADVVHRDVAAPRIAPHTTHGRTVGH